MVFNIFILRSATDIQRTTERQTMNIETYSDMLQNRLQPAMWAKLWSSVICSLLACLQRDNAWPHTTYHTMKQIWNLKLGVLPHLPHSPHFIPSNFHLFLARKRHSMLTSLQIRWGGERGSEWLVGIATKKLLLLRNLCRGINSSQWWTALKIKVIVSYLFLQ